MPIVQDDYAKILLLKNFIVQMSMAMIELNNMVECKMDVPADMIRNIVMANEYAEKEIKEIQGCK